MTPEITLLEQNADKKHFVAKGGSRWPRITTLVRGWGEPIESSRVERSISPDTRGDLDECGLPRWLRSMRPWPQTNLFSSASNSRFFSSLVGVLQLCSSARCLIRRV